MQGSMDSFSTQGNAIAAGTLERMWVLVSGEGPAAKEAACLCFPRILLP